MRSSNGAPPDFTDDPLTHRRLRAPGQHGEALDVPTGDAVRTLFTSNLSLRSNYQSRLSDFSAIARSNVYDAAVNYTRLYLPEVDPWLATVSTDRVVMAGHQPNLFHPGVWYKNFRLDALAKRFAALPINLVVDNDLMTSPLIRYPQRIGPRTAKKGAAIDSTVILSTLPMDAADAQVPQESRPIIDDARFSNFGDQAATATVGDPIIKSLWPEVLAARRIFGDDSLGRVVAAGRHRLEWAWGLRTLEVPISAVAGTGAFGTFASQILFDIKNFREVHNGVLLKYRKTHGIRSSSHPVPELTQVGQWTETPFWIWTRQDRQRRPLFVQSQADRFLISDLIGFEASVGIGHFPQWWSDEVTTNRIRIRPRALTTTMFHRLLVSDLFIHGIGGAKYDQVTDQIILDFFGVRPPGYLTSTATFHLPSDVTQVTPRAIAAKLQSQRSLRFHPEVHLPQSPEGDALKRQKFLAIDQLQSGVSKKRAHEKIAAVNQQMAAMLADQISAARGEIADLKTRLRVSQILHSREYSFVLHGTSIIDDLKMLADQ